MKISNCSILVFVLLNVVSIAAHADSTFEIIDGNAQVAGNPDPMSRGARTNWEKACDKWKAETKELNKNEQLMGLSCNTPSCDSIDNGAVVCSSSATYKVKINGTMVQSHPAPPVPEVMPVTQVIETPPPQVIVEAAPEPRPGFLWIVGYWGWYGHRHIWYPGHWVTHRPGYRWEGEHWSHHDRGYHFEVGHWRRG